MVWGPIADRFGRVRALMLTILFYSLFTFMCGLVNNIWQLAVLRVLCGIGLGGEQPMGGTFVAEEWPEDRRKMGAGLMHTGYYFGFFLAALANYFIGATYGWRWMFILGGAPALLVAWIRQGVREPATWQKKFGDDRQRPADARRVRRAVHAAVPAPHDRQLAAVHRVDRRAVGRVDLRPGGGDADCACAKGYMPPPMQRGLASYGSMVLAIATIIGCLLAPWLAERLGRRLAMGLYFGVLGIAVAIAFGLRFLRADGADAVLRPDLLPRHRRREFRDVHAVAARAVHDRLPGQRDRLRQLGRPLRRRGDGVPGRRRRSGTTAAWACPSR